MLKIVFFRISSISVTCPHAQLRCRTPLKSYGYFSDLGECWGWDRSESTPCMIFRVKQIHQSMASKRTTRLSYDILLYGLTTLNKPKSREVSGIITQNIFNAAVPTHSDLRDYISDTTRSFRRMHAWRLPRFISR